MTQQTPKIRLVADVGGTHVRFGLVLPGSEVPTAIRVLACRDYPSLEAAIDNYLSHGEAPRPKQAAIAVATPVTGDRVSLTNHTWSFSIDACRRRFALDELVVLNDFTALALSIPHLDASLIRQVGGGEPRAAAPKAVLGPGTGLGVSALIWSGERWKALEGEGGHVSYGGVDDREAKIIGVLRERFGNVSAERLLSGPGLRNLYQAICRLANVVAEELEPAEIAERGRCRTCDVSEEALRVFCGALGSVAGDLALTLGALGGVYIGGGIVPKLGDFLLESEFRARFEAHGRMRHYLSPVPCYVIHAPHPTLLGAAKAIADRP
jgi:glucokinase